jgi:hypothetical protein
LIVPPEMAALEVPPEAAGLDAVALVVVELLEPQAATPSAAATARAAADIR